MSLRALGWCSHFEDALQPWAQKGCAAARVATQHRGGYEVWTADGILTADVPGRFRHRARQSCDYPAVGDWVAIAPVAGEERAVIEAVLPRRTKLSRTAPGLATEEQIVVTNVDEVFVLESLATPPNLRRIERFLTFATNSGVSATILLTKADLASDVPGAVAAVSALSSGTGRVDVLAISAVRGEGLAAVRKRLRQGRTAVLVGRSGAGKSTLINHLAGDEGQFVLPVRDDDQKGRHATTSREMVFLPAGGVIIDTPGLRELQLWEGTDGLETAFPEIEALATRCRFTNCRHAGEPGCAVKAAVGEGSLPAKRLEAFCKLRDEITAFSRRRAVRRRAEEQRQAQNRRRHGGPAGSGHDD